MNKFQELKIWQNAIKVSIKIYDITKTFPKEELYGLTSQMRRCAVSIASNIAEGSKRNTPGEFSQFIGIARGSLAELETQTIVANKIGLISNNIANQLNEELDSIGKMAFKLSEHYKCNKKNKSQ